MSDNFVAPPPQIWFSKLNIYFIITVILLNKKCKFWSLAQTFSKRFPFGKKYLNIFWIPAAFFSIFPSQTFFYFYVHFPSRLITPKPCGDQVINLWVILIKNNIPAGKRSILVWFTFFFRDYINWKLLQSFQHFFSNHIKFLVACSFLRTN